ncbi:PP2C family protein-serine/threonine phosphatase [Streptomyces sp. NPDC053493]|uniref:PP2C family protein-serine/threonine phosphatase n=1 Tax=Streptomyces sp. NPDC053493 TaxID=3365705 RepID=UPI0037D07169
MADVTRENGDVLAGAPTRPGGEPEETGDLAALRAVERATGALMVMAGLTADAARAELERRADLHGRTPAAEALCLLAEPLPAQQAAVPHPPGAAPEAASAVDGATVRLFDALPGMVVLLTPLRSADGRDVLDFRIDAASRDAVDVAGRSGRELVGLRLLETYPSLRDSERWQGYVTALETSGVWAGPSFDLEEEADGGPRTSRFAARAAAWRGRLIVSWVRLSTGERERRRLAVMQRLGNLGWADWDLRSGGITWSEQVYTIFEREPGDGPLSWESLPDQVVDEDVPALAEHIRRLLAEGHPVGHTFRLSVPSGVRHVRLVAEAERAADGTPVEVHGFFQDLTAAKRAEQEILAHERAAGLQRDRLRVERQLAARLQEALLPVAQESRALPGLQVDVAYRPAEQGVNVSGDWYSAVELPDGSALLVVGDVAGHGLDSVATMAQLRFTAKGMAVTGTPLADILARLNTVLLHTADGHITTATVIIARYRPDARRLSWVQAGHLPPLMIRDGRPFLLDRPEGVLLGATPNPVYTEAELDLEPGDELVFYTDGLIETPGESLDDGLSRLTAMAAETPPEVNLLDHLLTRLNNPAERRDDICALHILTRP